MLWNNEQVTNDYLSLGMKLKRIHRGISFYESAWLKSYIDKNTKLRISAKNDFEKDIFKLLRKNNGKLLESCWRMIRKQRKNT